MEYLISTMRTILFLHRHIDLILLIHSPMNYYFYRIVANVRFTQHYKFYRKESR
uniref:Uncharacterized protein n=1 Tax=Siphoviridae sp. ctqPo10 TaxID=2827948 RepID=A0A8S5SUL8_9CAUD|nr:MAG TPA: hypothetical protein [Siphoviridae sp. ctqPo10]